MNPIPAPPISSSQVALTFGIPAGVLLVTFYGLNPLLVGAGVPLIWSFSLALYGTVYGLLIAALIGYWREGHPLRWGPFARRMRLKRLSGRQWVWVVGAVVLALLGDGLLEPLSGWVAARVPLPLPGALPALFDPFTDFELPPNAFFGVPLAGNSWVIFVYAVGLFGNIIGEELWWRGFLLPRMEASFGHWAWLVNGLLWVVVFHAATWWLYPTLLPTGLLAPFVAWRFRSTWASIAVHGMGNTLFIIFIAWGVFVG